jgi:ankyrin repeat protein
MGIIKNKEVVMLRRLSMALALCLALVMVAGHAASAAMSDKKFIEICERGKVSEVKAALKKGANPNARYEYGMAGTVLSGIISQGNDRGQHQNPEVIRALVQAGADVNARDKNGETVLMYAVMGEDVNLEVVKILVQAGADVNARDERGTTVLMCANQGIATKEEVLDILLKAGADVNARDKDGATILMQVGHDGQIDILVKAGADVSAQDKEGTTALMRVVADINGETPTMVNLLLKAGADVNMRDKKGKTALDVAINSPAGEYFRDQQAQVIAILKKAGAKE